MKCSQYGKCKFTCDGKVPDQFSIIITSALHNVMNNNKLPEDVASKISILLTDELDASAFCNKTVEQQNSVLTPKVRVLDRAIVNRFEQHYDKLSAVLSKKSASIDMKTFFHSIPRGKCLDIFLDVIKLHCIGPQAQEHFESKLNLLAKKHTKDKVINWQGVYDSKEYKLYMDQFFTIFFSRIKEHPIPLPALNIQLGEFNKPNRINNILKYMSKLWELRELDD